MRARVTAALLATLLVASGIGAAANVGGVAWDSGPAPNLQDEYTVTKAVHDMDWGASNADARKYEGNDGEVQTIEARVNESADNPYASIPTDWNVTDWSAFPHAKSDVSALESSEWSTDASGSAGSISTSDVETAPGVDAVKISTSGQTSGDIAKATFSNFSVTSDEAKRHLFVALDVKSIDSGATVEFDVVDANGDVKTAVIDTSRSSGEDFVTNASGEGIVYQHPLGELSTDSTNGDGNFNDIEKIVVEVHDADADVEIAGLNVEKMSMYDLGSERKDTDGDDELEDVEHLETKTGGALQLASLDSLGDTFSSAELHDLSISMIGTPEEAGAEDVSVELEKTDKYPGYHGVATIYVRMSLADAYDLSYSGAERTDEQSVTSDRVISVEYAEGVSDDTEFSEIEDATFTDKSSLYGSEGTNVTVDDTLQVGSNDVVKYTLKLDKSQYNAIQSSGGAFGGGAKGGGLSNLPVIGGIVVALLGVLRKFGG